MFLAALENYVKTKKARSTIQGFINNDGNHIESFIAKFKQVYKNIIEKSYKSKVKVDMKRIFQQSKSQTKTMVNGSKVLDEAMNAYKKLNSYIKSYKDKSRKHGFNLQTQVHKVLASQNIILLKEEQVCPELAKHVDTEYLLNNIRAKAMTKDVTVDSMMYLSLCTLFRDVNNTTDRTKLKIEINRLFEVASKEDRNIIEIFANLIIKLPNFERLSPAGEMELMVNFLNPALSPIFHCPDNNKHLMWLNRKDENTAIFRPDATTVGIQQKADTVTLGYVEVKPPDFESNPELAFMDLVRLGTFSRRLMLRENNRKVIVVQCIGYQMVFYLVSAFIEEITQLAEILSIDVPKEIGRIGCLLQKVDDFKRLFFLYEHQRETRYKISRALEEEDVAPPIDAINPKRRKQKIPSFSLV
ncbi:uncharacterized protein B0P05DRAFT_581496 [Gilbertella persicaria]|uniref:uncharacterized protein n=1 Tax=Gilbertella persicaria TaxID=101096 RepID=UPI00221F1114|nr:uncharacterized protein B0P05DRAFT_581496 [Gilbertella persicaria]KAI8058912.1 hypothetical protein B0P05DRAFT_581496 [Gilbertella persicaria]